MTLTARPPIVGVPIERSATMLPLAWMIYDSAGAVIGCGVFGNGGFRTPGKEDAIAARIVCGAEAFAALKQEDKGR